MDVRVRRTAEPAEPEPEPEPQPKPKHEPHPAPPAHHDYENMKSKFMNELEHLPCKYLHYNKTKQAKSMSLLSCITITSIYPSTL